MIILSTCSARPNVVKLAAVHHALKDKKDIRHIIVHTGQHYDPLLSDIFFTQLQIPQPDFNLGIKGGEDRLAMIQSTADAMESVLQEVKPDIVLVYGDVNGAVGAARAAKKLGIRIGHVEAGLRSFDPSMPEEHNRIEIDRLADLLFVSEQAGMDHLRAEKCPGKAVLVGNTMIDTLVRIRPIIEPLKLMMQEQRKNWQGKRYAIATIHRPSNVDDPAVLREVMKFLEEISTRCPILLPVHPRLKNALKQLGYTDSSDKLLLHDPFPYMSFLNWMKHADFILTDSGGIQEEAAFLGKRCFTLRRNTERPSTIESGSNVLIDPSRESDQKIVLDFASNPTTLNVTVPPLWDGKAGERIAEVLSH